MNDVLIHRGFAGTNHGQIHFAEAGQGKPVILLHQTPRSWDEYREILPIIGQKYRAIAMDTIGFGDSFKTIEPGSIERYAEAVIDLMDRLNIKKTSIVGHHTGGVIAMEVAIVGVPHEIWGETGHAFAIRKPGSNCTEADIISFCNGRLARFKWLSRVTFCSDFPRTSLGKIRKHLMRSQLEW